MPQPPAPRVELPRYNCSIVDVRSVVQQLFPAAFERMPFTARVFAENVIRKTLPGTWQAALEQVVHRRADADFPFHPARVVLQDLQGTPALVDLAGLRDAVAESGGAPHSVNPVVPTKLVVDHSLHVDVGGMHTHAMTENMAIEQRRNAERFEFLDWAKRAFRNVDIVMPDNGILHQINLERLSPVVHVADGVAFVDTLVGTDSHTTKIDALGVVGWGVGGIEADEEAQIFEAGGLLPRIRDEMRQANRTNRADHTTVSAHQSLG